MTELVNALYGLSFSFSNILILICVIILLSIALYTGV